jgi:hypothetical protein
MPGRKQHYLAAGYLAGFSPEPRTPRRESPIWVARRGVRRPYRQTCERVAYEKDLYTLKDPAFLGGNEENLALIDEAWDWVEQNIAVGVQGLITSCHEPLPASLWLSVLVPFAAQVFVRGADWIPRFAARFGWMEEHDAELHAHVSSADNANLARLMELQRLNPAMLAARWQVLHCPPGSDLIVNDLGRVGMVHDRGMQGYTVPLSKRAAVVLLRADQGCRVIWDHDRSDWFVDGIEHYDLTVADVDGLNAALRDSALVESYGPAPELVGGHGDEAPRDPAGDPFLEPVLIVPSPGWLRARETDWAKLITMISKEPKTTEDEGPWTVYGDLMPGENEARTDLHHFVLGDGAGWSRAVSEAPGRRLPSGRPTRLWRIASWLARR